MPGHCTGSVLLFFRHRPASRTTAVYILSCAWITNSAHRGSYDRLPVLLVPKVVLFVEAVFVLEVELVFFKIVMLQKPHLLGKHYATRG